MALPEYSMNDLLEAGAHFGHQKHRWNPKMESYIFGIRNNIHILDLSQTIPLLHQALSAVRDVTKSGGRILFVGTKRQGQEIIANAANDCAQYYMNHRWYGGTLTNWKTISKTISRLRSIEELLDGEDSSGLTKKELLKMNREREKLDTSIGGIKDMGGLPDLIFVLDTVKEQIAIQEATKLNIPIAAVIDSNSNPEGITYPIPGNDDSTKAIALYCDLLSKAALDGIAQSQSETADSTSIEKVKKSSKEKPTPKAEEPVAEEEAPKAEEPVAEEEAPRQTCRGRGSKQRTCSRGGGSKAEEPVAEEEAPKAEEPVAEEEAPKAEEPAKK
jgi:small subunit ribosomal protein S2